MISIESEKRPLGKIFVLHDDSNLQKKDFLSKFKWGPTLEKMIITKPR
jgi:hypothetical protein